VSLCFASNNNHKLEEVRHALGEHFTVLSLFNIGCTQELPETQDTLEGNSLQKAQFVFDRYTIPCFADDSGLEVDALNGAPGVYSARYAGEKRNSEDNVTLLLKNMIGEVSRDARFRTVITLVEMGGIHSFVGEISGTITNERRGNQGFGYDPVFQPNGYTQTFAEMSLEQKNKISHRAIAIGKLSEFLKSR